MIIKQRIFKIDQTTISIEPSVLEHMYSFTQYKCWDRESGGQLFSPDPTASELIISHITGPYKSDKTSRSNWTPDTNKLINDRESFFRKGLYVVGLWHTHPEAVPVPSEVDRSTCNGHLNLLDEAYTGFFLLTLGNRGSIPAISIYMATRPLKEWKRIEES